jgi:hypothetical protein
VTLSTGRGCTCRTGRPTDSPKISSEDSGAASRSASAECHRGHTRPLVCSRNYGKSRLRRVLPR